MKKLASLSVAFIVGMAVLSLPTLALAQGIEVLIGNTAELTDAGIVVPVTVTCVDGSAGADVEVQITQINTEGIAGGEGDLALEACGSTPQIVHVLVRYTGRIDVGEAKATAHLDACDSTYHNCNHEIAHHPIQDGHAIQIVD